MPYTSCRAGRRPVLAVALAALLFAVACGGDDDIAGPVTGGDATTTSAPEGSTEQDEAAFPVVIEHTFGSTEIAEEPERVVTVGFTDHDITLALGVTPVGLRQWYGDHERGVWPWAEDLLGDAEPELLPAADLNFEQIAALDPDLIIGLYIGLEQSEYDTLSEIAPTVAQSGEHNEFGTPWQEMTRTAGKALGRSAEAEEVIEEVEGEFAAAREAHPEFEGVGLAYAGAYGEEQYYVETEGSTRMQILIDLGFVVPDELVALGDDGFYHDLSAEQLELLDQDVVLWEPADLALLPKIEANPIYQALDVAKEDREVFLEDPLLAGAMAHSSVLSLPFLLDQLIPQLAEAVGRIQ